MNKKILLAMMVLLTAATALVVNQKIQQVIKIRGARTEKEIRELPDTVHGAILPHHDFAQEILIDSYQRLSKEQYQLVVIIGPNHFYPESREIITADKLNTKTAEATVFHTAKAKISDLDKIVVNNQVVAEEHSVGVQLEYLAEFLPEAEVLPLVVPTQVDKSHLASLATRLAKLRVKTLFIASVDFSHDLTYIQALENNQQSIEAIKSFNYQQISSFNDQHLDSPNAITLLLKIMQQKGADQFQVWHNTHGALLANDPSLSGTSYVIGVFKK